MRKSYTRHYPQRDQPVQILPDPVHGRKNAHIWNAVSYENSNHAIARRLGCDERTVMHQRRRRSYPPFPRGGDPRAHKSYQPLSATQLRRWGLEPLPERVVL